MTTYKSLSRHTARIKTALGSEVEGYTAALLRMGVGFSLLWASVLMLKPGVINGAFSDTAFRFSYPATRWLEPLPTELLQIAWLWVAVSSLFMVAGLFYRFFATTAALIVTYSFLLDASNYSNAFYILVFSASLVALAPVTSVWSLDNKIWKRPERRIPMAWLIALATPFFCVYFFAGIAKINKDWLSGQPLTILLAERTQLPLVGSLFTNPDLALVLSYFGLFFDLSVVFLVLFKHTRILGFVLALAFHTTNSFLFEIGYFPFLAFIGLFLFTPPAGPKKLLDKVFKRKSVEVTSSKRPASGLGISLLAFFVLLNIAVPLRHFITSDNFLWDEHGSLFAWHMVTAYKEGHNDFMVVGQDGEVLYQGPAYGVTPLQNSRMIGNPELIRQYSHYLANLEKEKNNLSFLPQVYVRAEVSLNGRPPQLLIDLNSDLSREEYSFLLPNYIVPLEEELPPREEVFEKTLGIFEEK